MSDPKDVRIIKAKNTLQIKAGSGTIAAEKIDKSQHVMENTKIDFTPMALEFIDQLEHAIIEAHTQPSGDKLAIKENLARPVMRLKASAALFGYPLVSDLAAIMLGLLDAYDTLDDEILAVVAAHHKTLQFIIVRKMSGDGGPAGAQFRAELENACQRYAQKRGTARRAAEHP